MSDQSRSLFPRNGRKLPLLSSFLRKQQPGKISYLTDDLVANASRNILKENEQDRMSASRIIHGTVPRENTGFPLKLGIPKRSSSEVELKTFSWSPRDTVTSEGLVRSCSFFVDASVK